LSQGEEQFFKAKISINVEVHYNFFFKRGNQTINNKSELENSESQQNEKRLKIETATKFWLRESILGSKRRLVHLEQLTKQAPHDSRELELHRESMRKALMDFIAERTALLNGIN
jgi:hypothetical protein